ncbi:hypothetical protein SK128_010921, partial [Halocaridina rubra]
DTRKMECAWRCNNIGCEMFAFNTTGCFLYNDVHSSIPSPDNDIFHRKEHSCSPRKGPVLPHGSKKFVSKQCLYMDCHYGSEILTYPK